MDKSDKRFYGWVEPEKKRYYGWQKDFPDFRDYKYGKLIPAEVVAMERLPAKVDLRNGTLTPYNQGSLGSCTAQAIARAIAYLHP